MNIYEAENDKTFTKGIIGNNFCINRLMWITSPYQWLFFFSLHTLAFEGLMISDNSSYIAVVAIDFGTTYSGFAFAFNHKEGEGGIHMNKEWGNEQGFSNLKTPTSLLLRPNGQFDSFGFEADEKYTNFFNGEDQEYMYFKRFKMTLHKSEVICFWFFEFYFSRVQKSDVIKNSICETMRFVTIFRKTIFQEAYLPKTSIVGQNVSEILAQLCSDDSIHTNPSKFELGVNARLDPLQWVVSRFCRNM